MEDVQECVPTAKDNQFVLGLVADMLPLSGDGYGRGRWWEMPWDDLFSKNSFIARVSLYDDVKSKLKRGRFHSLIKGVRGELDGMTSDPLLEVAMHYVQALNLMENTEDRFPCLLVCLTGPYIGIAGAIWIIAPQIEVLTPLYPLHTNCHETTVSSQLSRTLAATRRAVENLKAHYAGWAEPTQAKASLEIADIVSFPYKTHYDAQGPVKQRVEFRYYKRLNDSGLIFLTKTAEGKDLFIKFTRKYSAAAHKYCSDNGVAPTLHAVERLPGGWLMVVMDLLDETLYSYPIIPYSFYDKPTRDRLFSRITRAMNIMHNGGFVHGDFRNVNLMIRKEWIVLSEKEDPGVMIVDFDWSGEEGKVRYPANVNTEIFRPKGVEDGALIERSHDQAMLENIFEEEE
ncbi:hypothetical protein CPB86DRAFT_875337 [Serendipita vermifera]|nr:hypothetical protein CPB86DRAFT_875337 [Serendipita vermifera]